MADYDVIILGGGPGGFLAADQLRIAPDMDWGYRIPVMTEMALAIVLAGVQWHGTRGRPLERAALRWLMLSALVGCGLFVFTTAGHELFDLLPPLSQGYSFGFFLVMYAGIALGLRRYRLFQLAGDDHLGLLGENRYQVSGLERRQVDNLGLQLRQRAQAHLSRVLCGHGAKAPLGQPAL